MINLLKLRRLSPKLFNKKRLLRLMLASTFLIIIFVSLLLTIPLPDKKLNSDKAYRFYDHQGQLLNMIISKDGFFRMQINLEDISPLFIKSLLLYEDKYFFQHFGVNPLAIVRAAKQNISSSKIVSGGSTITMQLSRMLQRQKRSYWVKLVEIFRALQLEIRMSKKQILAHYITIAPYGGNIEGVEAAATLYFGKSARHLSVAECALLVALPKSPNRYRPDRFPQRAKQQRNKVLKLMHQNNLITAGQYQRALAVPVNVKRRKVKTLMAHAAWRYRLAHPKHYEVKTSIDENLQRRAKRLLKSHIDRVKKYNISNGAVVIIDNATREVRALVGSTNFFSKLNLGANDGTYSPRSPGSTLKPFIYALAMHKGLIAQKTMLYDVPTSFHGYSPINFSRSYRGLVSVQRSLADSLNVVAVELTRQVGLKEFHQLLKKGGISTLDKSPDYYGLPLVLGGVEVRLIELTNLYSSLANGGIYQPYKLFLTNQTNTHVKKRILSKEASWLTTHILTDVQRPDFPSSWQFSKNRPTIAWKTGTSYGHRDAWSIGFTPKYTIGVWVGNFNNSPSRGLIGGKAAAPLLFDLFQSIGKNQNQHWFVKPKRVQLREVCAISGRRPSRFCPRVKTEYYIKSHHVKSHYFKPETTHHHERFCQIHQPIFSKTDTATKTSYQVYEIWPPKVARFLHLHGVPVANAPKYQLDNMAGEKYYRPEIVSPTKGAIYYQRFDKLKPSQHGIRLAVAVTNRIKKVHWYLNNTLIASGLPYEDHIINPKPGKYTLTVVDDTGGKASMILRVEEFKTRVSSNIKTN